MPYIPEEDRKQLDHHMESRLPETVGELTYVLTREVLKYIGGETSFGIYAEALAALEAAKLELYRKRVAPHEDRKAVINGEVY